MSCKMDDRAKRAEADDRLPNTRTSGACEEASRRIRYVRWLVRWAALYLGALVAYLHAYPALEPVLVSRLQVRPSAVLIRWIHPRLDVHAEGASLHSPRLILDVRKGCDGMEAWLMLVTALAVYPWPVRDRLRSILWGTVLLYGLNIARMVSLFHIALVWPDRFEFAHGVVWQSAMVMAAVLFLLVQMNTTSEARR